MKEKKVNVGGQAVIEGVMMRGTKYLATAVRKSNGEIVYKKKTVLENSSTLNKIPFIRGTFVLIQSLLMGVKELNFSSKEAELEEEEQITDFQIGLSLIFAFAISIGLFMLLPSLIASLLGKWIFAQDKIIENIIEGILRLVFFLVYIVGISYMPDMKRVFQYHGAEHKSIYAFEDKKELSIENVKGYTTLHPRCGTSFLIMVMVISILVFSIPDIFLTSETTLLQTIGIKFILRIVLLPVVAGIAYEFQRFTGKYIDNKFIKILAAPGLYLQKITTKEPDESQLEVSIVALKVALGETVDNAVDISYKYNEDKVIKHTKNEEVAKS
ncbi:MAG: DUF1385 domain-containing protein [Fusobacteria bacterium]|nr:DUF1385 domain-containing protein [Fusobacteriota bacterium]